MLVWLCGIRLWASISNEGRRIRLVEVDKSKPVSPGEVHGRQPALKVLTNSVAPSGVSSAFLVYRDSRDLTGAPKWTIIMAMVIFEVMKISSAFKGSDESSRISTPSAFLSSCEVFLKYQSMKS